ncbi:MAG: hypothetical protein N4A49_10975 [Marinifilaceae bacterium]|jgi:hypothetical protein|nr:hypothetical protein [Marinifilaceae bacterium]
MNNLELIYNLDSETIDAESFFKELLRNNPQALENIDFIDCPLEEEELLAEQINACEKDYILLTVSNNSDNTDGHSVLLHINKDNKEIVIYDPRKFDNNQDEIIDITDIPCAEKIQMTLKKHGLSSRISDDIPFEYRQMDSQLTVLSNMDIRAGNDCVILCFMMYILENSNTITNNNLGLIETINCVNDLRKLYYTLGQKELKPQVEEIEISDNRSIENLYKIKNSELYKQEFVIKNLQSYLKNYSLYKVKITELLNKSKKCISGNIIINFKNLNRNLRLNEVENLIEDRLKIKKAIKETDFPKCEFLNLNGVINKASYNNSELIYLLLLKIKLKKQERKNKSNLNSNNQLI